MPLNYFPSVVRSPQGELQWVALGGMLLGFDIERQNVFSFFSSLRSLSIFHSPSHLPSHLAILKQFQKESRSFFKTSHALMHSLASRVVGPDNKAL